MVNALIDTSVVVDLLRQYPSAEHWFAAQGQLGVSRAVWLEVLEGAENKRKQQHALKILRRFEPIEIVPEDVVWSINQLLVLGLSHNIDAFDCLIAASSQRLQLPLFTRNMKHFVPLIGSLAQQPF
mgnify:CR=1 FL=1